MHQVILPPPVLGRRGFLSAGLSLGMLATLLPVSVSANTNTNASASAPELWLDLQRAGQRMRLNISTQEGYKAAAWMLRDIQAGNQTGWPSPNLLVYAAHLQRALAQYHSYTVFSVTSGLRTQATNRRIEGAAQHSLHLPDSNNQFHAMDLKPMGATLDQLATLASSVPFGGVGRYDTHLHLDARTSPARW